MPSNAKQLIGKFKKRAAKGSAQEDVMQVVASSVTRNLARFTNVLDGYLAGHWTVIVSPNQSVPSIKEGQVRTGPINKTRQISLKNVELIDSIKAGHDVVIGNAVFYGPNVNSGTRFQRANNFVPRAARTSQAELALLGIKIEVING